VPESDVVDDGRGMTLSGVQRVAACAVLEQSAWARSAVSCPATYTGAWDLIRKLLARTPAARVAGFDASRFSPTSRDGRCGVCRGRGMRPAAVEGLEELVLTCPACHGDRFNAATLSVRYRGRNAAQLLALRFDEAAELFAGIDRLRRICQAAVDCGLGYIVLGQPAWTLSGGEAQRLRIARALSRTTAGEPGPIADAATGGSRRGTVYLLDEPTAGQHPSDVARLVELLDCLVAQGDTVIAVEHNLDLISACDHVIDLGPGSGSQGGRIVAAGSPDEIAACAASFTGAALRARR
jgi:excinuclease ABC subunit A